MNKQTLEQRRKMLNVKKLVHGSHVVERTTDKELEIHDCHLSPDDGCACTELDERY